MSPEAQRIAIAEACGWQAIREDYKFACGLTHSPGNGLVGVSPINVAQGLTNPETCSWVIPDYLSDLNAMREAFATLPEYLHISYGRHLQTILNEGLVGYISDYPRDFAALARIANASASDLAEALLRTLNLWTE